MKKLIVILALFLGVLPFASHAAVFGFMDNKFYNIEGNLQYFGFMDGTFFDTNGKQVYLDKSTGQFGYTTPIDYVAPVPTSSVTVIPAPQNTNITFTPQPTPSTVVTTIPEPTPTPVSIPTITPTLLPAYTLQNLLYKICDISWNNYTYAGQRQPYPCNIVTLDRVYELYGPISGIVITPTTVQFNLSDNAKILTGDWQVVFNGQTVSDSRNNAGYVQIAPNEFTSVNPNQTTTGLTPDTEYSYQVIYHEEGRQDLVINKTFRTGVQ